ncbi:MAG: transketolase [Rickettsiales bacterium]|nr:transketolase [Rickettsiales bacterium]|tara:strand:+ start:14363 stop:16342 length:1980 start_codon:yes stop_codon:yes gene_type:complete
MTAQIKKLANCIRFLSIDAIEKAKSGHPGLPMGMADVMTVLYKDFLKYNPKDPKWFNRDRFVLSAGHGSMMLYAILYLTGYKSMTIDQIKRFRQLGSETPGHPEYNLDYGIETTTGPLGQGVANAVGIAFSERIRASKYPDIIDYDTYVLAGDGCLMEGIAFEAISFAGHQKLSKLTLLFDDNGITIDGKTDLSISVDHEKLFESCGWGVLKIDGHNPKEIHKALSEARKQNEKPMAIFCKTIIGFGAPNKSGTEAVHGSPLGKDEAGLVRKNFNWPYEPFEIPSDLKQAWEEMSLRCMESYTSSLQKLNQISAEQKDHLQTQDKREIHLNLDVDFPSAKLACLEAKDMATRKCSEIVLSDLFKKVPELIGGSADLTGSNNTLIKGMQIIQADRPNGNYIHYGIREHAMAGIMNGLALDGSLIPYGGTFLVFSDYCRPSIRLSALMGLKVIYVFTHDSIGLGEDGPTHQPIEQLMSLRLIPGLNVFRPADLVETAEAWHCALQEKDKPSAIVLSRQNLPQINHWRQENRTVSGAYIISGSLIQSQYTIIATGSEVSLALAVQENLKKLGFKGTVVSMPCVNYFESLNKPEKEKIIGCNELPKFVIEAGVSIGWTSILEQNVTVFGVDDFGVSAPKDDAYSYFQLTPEDITKKISKSLNN